MTEEVIMSRDAEGVTKIGGITFQIPQDRSALSVLTTPGNRFYDGEKFSEDGWVYGMESGKKLRKWFVRFVNSCSSYADARIWEPKLQDIAKLEERRWFFHQRSKAILEPMWPVILKKIKDAGHFGGYHQFSEKGKGYLEFNKHEWHKTSAGVSWDWCEKDKMPPVINQELTDEWFHYEWICKHVLKPSQLYDSAFFRAIERRYADSKRFPANRNINLHLTINGRHYWFGRDSGKYAEAFFSKLAYPEDTQNVEETL